jgi:hypothetical protein
MRTVRDLLWPVCAGISVLALALAGLLFLRCSWKLAVDLQFVAGATVLIRPVVVVLSLLGVEGAVVPVVMAVLSSNGVSVRSPNRAWVLLFWVNVAILALVMHLALREPGGIVTV